MTLLKLMPFQEEGVRFLLDSPYRLLADDMGLGKTIQAIVAANRARAKSMLVICPASVKVHWARKILQWSNRRWQPNEVFIVRDGKSNIPPDAQVIIVNYDLTLRGRIKRQLVARGEQRGYDVVCIDEAHYLKNRKAKRTRAILGPSSFLSFAKRVWTFTGTPVLNRPAEFYPLLRALAPELIDPYLTWQSYTERFCEGRFIEPRYVSDRDDVDAETGKVWDTTGYSHLDDLAQRIEPFMLRRTKDDVLDELPDKIETVVTLDIEPPLGLESLPIATARRELALAKVDKAIEYVAELVANVGKVVVFSHHRDAIHALDEGLRHLGPVIVYGGMSVDDKQRSIDSFISSPAHRVFIGQTLAGGVGIDGLQGVSSNVVFLELDWSPGNMDQAVDRIRRIGQKDTVFVHYLSVPGSLDDYMADVLVEKRQVIERLILASEVNPFMSLDNLLERIATALETIANTQGGSPASEPAPKSESKTTKAAKAAKASKTVEEPTPEPAKQAEVTYEQVSDAATQFIMDAHPTDQTVGRRLIKECVWPQFGCAAMKELKPEQYAEAIAALRKGPEAYAPEESADDEDL